MIKHQQRTLLGLLLSGVWSANFLGDTTALTSHGTMELSYNNVPWFSYNKANYPTYPSHSVRPSWYPVSGPYAYGPPGTHPATPPPQQSVFQEHPTGFHQQQIVHIHDVGPPDLPRGDNYQEGNDYNIQNVISNIETPHHDLTEVASSKVETRKQKPNTRIKPTAANHRRGMSKSSNQSKPKTQKRSNKIQQSQANQASRPRPQPKGQTKTRPKTTTRKSSRGRPPPRQAYEQKRQLQRRSSQRRNTPQQRKTRPTRRTPPRNPYYGYDDYNDSFNGKRRRYKDYRNYEVYDDYAISSEEDLARQDDNNDDYDNDNEDNSTDESTTAETEVTEETTSATTITSTETPETTTASGTTTETTTKSPSDGYDHNFEGYGPSNGNENISITYAPGVEGRVDFDGPLANFWYLQQGSPENFQHQNYFSNGIILK